MAVKNIVATYHDFMNLFLREDKSTLHSERSCKHRKSSRIFKNMPIARTDSEMYSEIVSNLHYLLC